MDENGETLSVARSDDINARDGRSTKRRRVDPPAPKRVSKACSSCRRLKEKCDGRSPCARCVRYGRKCGSDPAASDTVVSTDSPFGGRVTHLEAIAKHFLGDVPLDDENLERVVHSLGARASTSTEQSASTGASLPYVTRDIQLKATFSPRDISHNSFTSKLHSEVNSHLRHLGVPVDDHEPLGSQHNLALQSDVTFRTENLPPKDVALFLSGVYFDFAQTSTTWVDRGWVSRRIDRLYMLDESLTIEYYPSICSVLVVLAIGVLYASMPGKSEIIPESHSIPQEPTSDHEASIKFYRVATDLIPDVMLFSSVDSAQAFVLLAQFSLCWDDPRLAHQYLSMAIAIGQQSTMERKLHNESCCPSMLQHNDRLLQVAFSWQKRLSILHGISCPADRMEQPRLQPAESKFETCTREAGDGLMMRLTDWLEDFAACINQIHEREPSSQAERIQQLIDTRTRYKQWWSSQPISKIPILQLNRHTGHLHLYHHLNLVFLGRTFIFATHKDDGNTDSTDVQNTKAELVDDAEYSSYEIIDICSMLDKSNGLAKASYVESSTCRAAVLVMLAQSLVGRCPLFRGKLQEGIVLARKLSISDRRSTYSVDEILVINGAINKLAPHERNQRDKGGTGSNNAYQSFQEWAKMNRGSRPAAFVENDALISMDGFAWTDSEGLFSDSLLDTAFLEFDPTGLHELKEGLDVY